jgi:methionine synthase II (cobalamin-independent)
LYSLPAAIKAATLSVEFSKAAKLAPCEVAALSPDCGFDTSSQSEQKDALNLSVHKDAGTDNEIPSPTSISRSR